MRNTQKTKEVIEREDLISVQCDICGKVYDDTLELQEFHYIQFIGGYGSIFGDGLGIQCDVCQYCLHKIIKGKYKEN